MAQKFAYSMQGVGKTYPPNKQVLRDIYLSFYYGAKIGILGLNGAGKSTLLKIIAGEEKNFNGDARPTEGMTIGYLHQEPKLDEAKTVLWSGPAGLAAFSDAPPVPENCALPIHELSLHRAIRNKQFVMVLTEEEKQMIDIQSPSFHLSSGPRAFLEYLERLSLPGVMALDPAEE